MGFSTYGLEKLRRDLRRKRVYKEKLRKLHNVEYGHGLSNKSVRTIPESKVKKTLERLERERPQKKYRQRTKNILVVLLSLLLTWSVIYLLQYLLFENYL
jgi:hypothetical protein